MGNQNEQSTPLLVEDVENFEVSRKPGSSNRWTIAAIVLVAYSFVVTGIAVYSRMQTGHLDTPYSAAADILSVSNRIAHMDGSSVLSSDPSPENHDAWRKLLLPQYVNVTEDEVRQSGSDPRTAVRLTDGNYLAVFGVYHQLHCMRWLYYLAHEEIYWRNMTTAQRKIRRDHGKHCIQTLTDYLMCKPDTALYPVTFEPTAKNPLQLMSGAEWQCVNWDSVQSWALERNQGYDPTILAPDALLDELRRSTPGAERQTRSPEN